ncbi:DMT family transporter [Pseudoxanthobacter sp.]|uniref:DMT family transporter n=1 Tax=Pseudoxanthobacter sp. TaxID=1925742 RepID=UPI002FE07E9A
MRNDNRRLGIALVLGSALLWSTAGIFIRMAGLDIWSVVGWRSLFSAAVLGGFVLVRNRLEGGGAVRSFGWPGLVATGLAAFGGVAYVAALTWTTVANVMAVYATLPFLAAAFAFLLMGERTSLRCIAAGVIAFAGISVMAGAAVGPRDLLGIVTAFFMTASFALVLVIARRYPAIDSTRITALAAATCALVALPFMSLTLPQPHQLLACALYGVVSTGISYIMVMIGGRMIGSGEAGFLSLIDVVLGPVWVWLLFNETISRSGLAGGFIVLVAVVFYLAPVRRPALAAGG